MRYASNITSIYTWRHLSGAVRGADRMPDQFSSDIEHLQAQPTPLFCLRILFDEATDIAGELSKIFKSMCFMWQGRTTSILLKLK